MEIKSPTFVLITGAEREFIYCDTHLAKATIERRDYSKGEVGLLHPAVVRDFERAFAPQHEGETFYGKLERNMNTFNMYTNRPEYSSHESFYSYVHTKGDLPVILYAESQDRKRSEISSQLFGAEIYPRRNPGYFIATLFPKEFQTLKETKLEKVCDEIKKLYLAGKQDYKMEEIQESVRWLLAFDILMQDAYTHMPIEVTRRKYKQEEAQAMERFYTEINALEYARRR